MKWMLLATLCAALGTAVPAAAAVPDSQDDLRPISAAQWTPAAAAHLLQRAGFGGRPDEIAALAALTAQEAVRRLVRWQSVPEDFVAFDESGLHEPGLDPFPASRPAATNAAKRDGQALGVPASRPATAACSR